MITVLDIAWAAGIYEGEGSCRPGLIDRNGIAATGWNEGQRRRYHARKAGGARR